MAPQRQRRRRGGAAAAAAAAALLPLLLLLGLLAGGAHARLNDDDPAGGDAFGRGLLQTLNCKKVHKACNTCRTQRIPGTKNTQLVCSTCVAGWRLRPDGKMKTCDCAPGFASNLPNFNAPSAWCEACPPGKYCVGGGTQNPDSGADACPAGLATIFAGAKSVVQCFTTPGYGRRAFTTGNGEVALSASACPRGTFNVGKNTAGCQKCAAGLTTAGTGTNSSSSCIAPAGSYMDRGIGRLCPKGTYTTSLNKAIACTPCVTGVTTATEGSTSASACSLAIKGYYLTSTSPAAAAAKCPLNTYNDQEAAITNCTACPNAWRTQQEGAAGQAFCLAPPGYELLPNAAAITPCASGWFKADWNRNPCVACGDNLITDDVGSVAKDACLVQVGYGLVSLNPLAAQVCTLNSYGSDVVRPALAGARCTACAPNTYTIDALAAKYPALAPSNFTVNFTSETDCLVGPGWGATETLVDMCRLGFYNPGFNRQQCVRCPAGYTTLVEGATNITDCVIQPGWAFNAAQGVPQPCDKGTWSAGGDATNPNGQCVACPVGYSTQEAESTSADDCNVCGSGYGGNACGLCPYDTFASGGAKVGDPCRACASGAVSARGAGNSEQCYPALLEPYGDYFPLSDDSLWASVAGARDSVNCAGACASDDACATYRWSPWGGPQCQVLRENATTASAGGAGRFLGFQVGQGADYSFFAVPAGLVAGRTLATLPGTVTATSCADACTRNNECEGVVFDAPLAASGACTLVASQLDADWVGQMHVVGSKLLSDRL